MKPRLHINLKINNNANALIVKSNLQASLVGKDIFDMEFFNISKDNEWNILLSADIRFNKKADRDSIKKWAQDFNNSPNGSWILSGSRFSWHDCSHDDSNSTRCKNDGEFIKP